MSKCINKIAGYDSKIRAPRMLYNIDRGLSEASLKEKNPGLEMKLEKLLSKNKSKPKYPETAKDVETFKDIKKGDTIITYHASPSSDIKGGRFEIREPLHGGDGFPRGIHSAPQIHNPFIDLDSGEFGDSIFKLETTIKGDVLSLSKPDPKLIKRLVDDLESTYDDIRGGTHLAYLIGKIQNGKFIESMGIGREFLLRNGIDTIIDGHYRLISLNPDNVKIVKKVKGSVELKPVRNKSIALEREDAGLGMEQLSNDDIALVGGIRSGNSQGDETRLKYTVYDMKAITKNDDMANANDYILGDVELFVEDGTGKIRGLVELNIKDKKKGVGRKVIDSLMASDFVNSEFKIHSIKKSAIPFWKKMGVEFELKNPRGSYVGDGIIKK